MQNSYKTVEKAGTGEIEEKKSRFLAEIRSVHSEEEAAAFLEEIRKKYWNASHHCLAYRLAEGGIMRSSDDGEPGGTAGRPILDVLTGADLYDTAAIVTRYFGGTLLGTGGLTRAYGSAARAAQRKASPWRRACAARVSSDRTAMSVGIWVCFPPPGRTCHVAGGCALT